jgi:hypothetical protein
MNTPNLIRRDLADTLEEIGQAMGLLREAADDESNGNLTARNSAPQTPSTSSRPSNAPSPPSPPAPQNFPKSDPMPKSTSLATVVTKAEFKTIAAEIMPPREAVLQDACKALEKLRKIVCKHEETFHSQTLGPRLQIGLQCLKAHQVFTIKDPKKTGGMKGKKAVTRDGLPTEGFEGWLATEAQWLKKPTAYKYMTAVRGLGLDHTATEKQVAAALKLLLRKGPVTVAGLVAASLDQIGQPPPPPQKLEQQEFEFLRDHLSAFRVESENLCRLKPQLDAYPDFKRAATARVYSMLWELTGTHWRPSDEPDSLADVDPDAITI